jgi:hypothetical protein
MEAHKQTAKLWLYMAIYIFSALALDYMIFGPQI